MPTRRIDHIVYAVPDLAAACQHIEDDWGIRPRIGGRHLTQGTQNALLNLGQGCYLEILALDPSNQAIAAPRWMGIDLIDAPLISRWALRSSDLKADQTVLRAYHPEMGTRSSGERQTTQGDVLRWKMILPLANPEVELVPFMVDWRSSHAHPCDQLPAGCQLRALHLYHPAPASLTAVLHQLGDDRSVQLAAQPRMVIDVETPNGLRQLG